MHMNHTPSSPLKTLRVPFICSLTSAPALAARETSPLSPTALTPLGRAGSRIGRLRARARRQGRGRGRGAGVAGDGRVEEGPRLAGCKLQTIGAQRIGDVAAAVRDPGYGRPGAAIRGLYVALLPGRGLRCVFGDTAIGLHPLIAQLAAEADA
jgi:hypothetical protein